MTKQIVIDGREIGIDHKPYIIAELSANHGGELDRALRTIEAASDCGADAIKLQTYRPDTITLKSDSPEFVVEGGLWDGRTLYDLYEEAHMPWEWHEPLFARARELGITIFSSPFDATAVDLLEDLGAPAYKIASFEVIDLPLLAYAASKGKPLIISTGMASANEIQEAVDTARSAGAEQIVVLHCVSAYPADPADYNLRTIAEIGERYGVVPGLSDHTIDDTTAIAAVAMGAAVIEKHFILDRAQGGPDSSFSIEPSGLKQLVKRCETAWRAKGRVLLGVEESEKGNIEFRRSLYFVKDLAAGEVITSDAIRSVRPGYGMLPKFFDSVVGKRVNQPVKANTPVTDNLLADTPA